jgi:hypothetical protein
MVQQIINIGVAPNDGSGDPVRVAFDKANQNFAELYKNSGGPTTGTGYTGSRGYMGYVGSLGYSGSQGLVGPPGVGIKLLGRVATYTSLPTVGNLVGDAWFVAGDSNVYLWNTASSTWSSIGQIVGYSGSQGLMGYNGSQGALGYTGSNGLMGYTGSRGVGYTGSTGYTGSRGVGYTGSLGYQGSSGTIGYTGSVGTGYTGSIGFVGSTGYTGSVGTGYTGSVGTGYTGSAGSSGSVSSLVNGSKTVSLDGSNGNLTFTNGEQIRTNVGVGGIQLYQSSDNTITIFPGEARIRTFVTGGAKHDWSFGSDGNLELPNASNLRPSTAAYDTALAGWESIRGGYITTTISNNLATALGWPMVNWYPTGPTAQGYIDFLLNAKTLQDTAGSTLIIQPAISMMFYTEMRAALIAIRDSYNTSAKGVSVSTAYSKSWNFGENGSLTLPGPINNIQVGTVAKTGTGNPLNRTAIDLTKTVNKLSNNVGSKYALADGVEGQIVYLVPQDGATNAGTQIIVNHGRVLNNAVTTATVSTDIAFNPFANDTGEPSNVVTMIFTDGAWQSSSGLWD